ncbi:MAG: hypothetical protein HRU15_01895, partial [Planctomycetes bacterium]|nr:hypothetical protein [Planctomycetota bacterium]
HVVSLPSHAAVAWAEEKDEQWHTYVLQTGPALEFTDKTLQNSLQHAYKHFDEGDTFDPNGLSLLLRFSGENTRSGWRLSYRIFSEPDYAKTMIDVQRDWHFQTYQRAIHKMLEMIKNGDEDTANYRELSGLYSFTGQYSKAAEYHAMAIERTPEATSKLFMAMELVQHLMDAGKKEEAIKAAQNVYDQQLPDLKESLAGAEIQFALQMAGYLNHEGSYDLGLKFLSTYVQPTIAQTTSKITEWINSPSFNQDAWKNSGQLRQLRRLLKRYINNTLGILQKRGIEDIHTNKIVRSHFNLVQRWMNTIGPHELDEMDDVLNAYSIVANYYLTHMDIKDVLDEVDKEKFPDSTTFNHNTRINASLQFTADVPWIKLSVPFWFGQTAALFSRDEKKADKKIVNAFYKNAEDAYNQCVEFEIASAFTQKQIHYMRVIHALMNEDEKSMRSLLVHVKAKNDKRLRDDTAQWIGDCARSMSIEWFEKVTQIWVDELDYKPKYYWIAWRAALNKAPQHALHIAKVAAERFKDDPAFVEEYEFMKVLFGTN